MPKKKWNELSPRSRKLIAVGSVFETVLKVIALVDLSRRPAAEVRGDKRKWAAAITFVNAFGAVPILYLLRGRRPER